MEIAKVKVTGTRAETIEALDIPEGIVGATVSFEFGPEWAGLTKNVVFVGAKDMEILNTQDSVYLPPEVVSAPNIIVKVGIVGVDANKKMVIPTLWADLGTVKPGAPVGMGYEPTLPIWAQTLDMIGNLRELDTEAKNNLVAAINEVKRIAEANDIDLTGFVKSVNGIQPDPKTGNVAVEIPKYTLPIAGSELGGVKNGGNVVINADGTMTAGAGVHTGPEPPEDTSMLWVDTDDEADDVSPLDNYYTKGETDKAIKDYVDTAIAGMQTGGGMVTSAALLSPGYTVMDDMSLSVEIPDETEETTE